MASAERLDECAPFPLMLAPMVGLTHFVVRKAIQECLPPGSRSLWPTEMLNSRRIPLQKPELQIETRFDDRDAGLCPQLLGNEEGCIRESIAKLVDWGARAIDINMGCPVRRALQHNYGVALMGDPDYAAEITAIAVRHAQGLPVSVKLRAAPPPRKEGSARSTHPLDGEGPDPEYLKAFCLKLQDAGASWITLHPRTATQLRRGDADWSQIAAVKRWLRIPVIGNGDVQTSAGARRMFAETGCDRVMVGRGLVSKPWMLAAFAPQPGGAPVPQGPAEAGVEAGARYGRFLARVLELSREHYPEALGVRRFRFLVSHGSLYLEYGHAFYSSLLGGESYDHLGKRITEFFGDRFDRPQKMAAETALRN